MYLIHAIQCKVKLRSRGPLEALLEPLFMVNHACITLILIYLAISVAHGTGNGNPVVGWALALNLG